VRSFCCYPLAFIFLLALSSTLVAQRDRDTYSSASANSLEVVGQVRMAESGLAANRIPVRLERFGGGVVDQIDTDSTGRFRFSNLSRGYYRVIVNAPGYKPTLLLRRRRTQAPARVPVTVPAWACQSTFLSRLRCASVRSGRRARGQ